MSVVIFNNTFDNFLISKPRLIETKRIAAVQHYQRRAKYIDQSRAGGISAITDSSLAKISHCQTRFKKHCNSMQWRS